MKFLSDIVRVASASPSVDKLGGSLALPYGARV